LQPSALLRHIGSRWFVYPYDGARRKDVTVNESDWQAEQFERYRPKLRAVAYRMLGTVAEAEDAVQEAWLRLSRSDTEAVVNLGGWLTTVVGRVCLDMLRTRRSRREDYVGSWLPEPVVSLDDSTDPEQEALLADSVGLALLVVLETLSPAERLAFVLHDMFAVPFEELAPIVGRSPAATRQLASRARRRVRGAVPAPDPDLARQREVVDAFLAAARGGDFEALLAVLDPDVVFRIDGGASRAARPPIEGADAVAQQILSRGIRFAPLARPALVNGAAGAVVGPGPTPFAVVGFTVVEGRIKEIDVIFDPDKLGRVRVSS
jgi:RNA polymerase sigma-70 factor, ECF subfamily